MRWVTVSLTAVVGTVALAAAVAGVLTIGNRPAGGLILLTFGAMLLLLLYSLIGRYLWADDQRVGSFMPLWSRSLLRDDLAYIRLPVSFVSSGTPAAVFFRKDGSAAFLISRWMFGKEQLASLARFVGVPLIDEADQFKRS